MPPRGEIVAVITIPKGVANKLKKLQELGFVEYQFINDDRDCKRFQLPVSSSKHTTPGDIHETGLGPLPFH